MALGLKLYIYICSLGLSTKPSILVQPMKCKTHLSSFKIYIKLYMNFWLQLDNWPMQLMHLSMLSLGDLTFSRKKLSKSTPQGHHHWSKNGNTPYLRKSILGQKTVIFPPSGGWENLLYCIHDQTDQPKVLYFNKADYLIAVATI